MKTNGTRILIIAIILYICLVIFSFTSFAVPDYNLSSGSYIGGPDKMIGGRDRFNEAFQPVTYISEGASTLLVSRVGHVKPDNCLAVLEIDQSTYNQKILKK